MTRQPSDRQTCTKENPMPKGASGRWEHDGAYEHGDGCSEGCCADYVCPNCGHKWREELPQ